jgi:hypothetical protein
MTDEMLAVVNRAGRELASGWSASSGWVYRL